MVKKMICPHCKVMISTDKYHKHKSRNRCKQQHIRKE